MVTFNNRLITVVTGTANNKQSFALFRGEEGADGKWTYTPLVGDPADGARYEYGFGATRSGAANMVVYKNHLYLGGYNDPMVALPDVLSTMESTCTTTCPTRFLPVAHGRRRELRTRGGLRWGEDTSTPRRAPATARHMRAGLGEEHDISRYLNQYVWRMQSYDGKMYAGTFDISDLSYPVTQFANGDILHRTPEEWKKQIEYIKKFLETTETDASGASTYALTDGSNADGAAADDIAKVQRMESLMQEMQGDLESKQTDVQADGTAPMALDDAEEYTIENREDFQKMLEELLARHQQVRPMLPDYVVEQLDKWLTQENVENFTYFVGVYHYLHSANCRKSAASTWWSPPIVLNFQTVTRNGFGDNNNHGLRVFAVTNSGLAVGTANPYHGAQVWLLNDGTEVKNASLTAGNAFTYDKYDAFAKAPNAAGLNVGVNFNGNTVESVGIQLPGPGGRHGLRGERGQVRHHAD